MGRGWAPCSEIGAASRAPLLESVPGKSKNNVSSDFPFPKRATLADIPGVSDSYPGVISAGEFMKVIADDNGSRRQIFFDNVRDHPYTGIAR
ncbi:hypothetical protein [Microbacterium aurum]